MLVAALRPLRGLSGIDGACARRSRASYVMADSSAKTSLRYGPVNRMRLPVSRQTVGLSQAVLAHRLCGTAAESGRVPVIYLHIATRLVQSPM